MSYRTESDIAFSTTSTEGDIIPLTGISVEGTLAGPFLSVTMKQRWTNFAHAPLEALWHFPLPAGAVVRSLAVERKGKKQVAKAEPCDKAFEAYDKAIDEGSRAALLDAITEGVLSLRLGNLDAHDSMLVEVSWVQIVEETAGSLRVKIPTSIAPRYFPTNWKDKSPVPREEKLSLPWESDVPYGISVAVNIEDPDSVREVTSPSHQMTITMTEHRMIAQVGSDFSAMDRDFVLDVKLKTERPAKAWIEQGKDAAWLAVDLRLPEKEKRDARNVAFLIDVSGSMTGESLDAAKTAMKAALGALGREDHFGLFAFSDSVIDGQQEPLCANQDNAIKARGWIDNLETSGGTELGQALDHVWKKCTWTDVLVLTDGEVGDDAMIALAAKTALKSGARLHLLGIGSAPAGDAIARIAHAGGGIALTIHPNERIEPKVLSVTASIHTGFADQFSLKAVGKKCELAAPASVAMGTRARILARIPDTVRDIVSIELSAQAGRAIIQMELPVSNLRYTGAGQGSLEALWAQTRISHRYDELSGLSPDSEKSKKLIAELEKVALAAGILSTVTSLVLVDESGEKVNGSALFLEVPVAVPFGYGAAPGNFDHSIVLYQSLCREELENPMFEHFLSVQSIQASPRGKTRSKSNDVGRVTAQPELFFGKPKPRWWDIFAVQFPGGGFGPLVKVLELLDIRADEIDADVREDEHSSRILATALCLTWLDMQCSKEATEWEPLVDASRNYLAESIKKDSATTARAMELARRVFKMHMD
jgi:Ca-activated chloride channel family protein